MVLMVPKVPIRQKVPTDLTDPTFQKDLTDPTDRMDRLVLRYL